MRTGVVKYDSLISRADVNFNLTGSINIKNSWDIGDIKDIVVRDPMCYGFQYCKEGVPLIRISDLKQPFIDYTCVARISDDVHSRFSKTHLEKFDILMSVRGVSIGKIGIFMGEYEKANISPNIIIIRLEDKRLAPYVCMVLISSIGQDQIKRIVAGSSKPTITAPLINKIKIPIPEDNMLKRINTLFFEAFQKRVEMEPTANYIEYLFEKALGIQKKEKTLVCTKNMLNQNRWDAHYHNKKFEHLRDGLASKKCIKLKDICISVRNSLEVTYEDKVGYIEISSINNINANIENFKVDYINKLPRGSKIPLKDEDILVSKVRPYRNAIAIFKDDYQFLCAASKNGFSVYRTLEYNTPYYILAYLRCYYGINQIIMNQSGTSYPTVSENDIDCVEIPILGEKDIQQINDLSHNNMKIKTIERDNIQAILEIIDFQL